MFLVELAKSFHRLRTWLLGALAVAAAVLPVVLLANSPDSSGGPPFFNVLRHSGLVGPLVSLFLIQPFFLPLAVGLLSGDAIAGEAAAGTLRYLLVRPVARTALVLEKYAAVVALTGLGLLLLLVVGVVAGGIAFGFGPVPTLSGSVVGVGSGLLRLGAAAGYVLLCGAAVAAIGLLISTLTDSGPGATVATVAVVIVSQILDGLSGLRALHPWLLTDAWFAWPGFFRQPIDWTGIIKGLELDAGYIIVFLGAALLTFLRRDLGG